MYAVLTFSNSMLSVSSEDGKSTIPVDDVIKEKKDDELEDGADSDGDDDNSGDLVEGGKVNLDKYADDIKRQGLAERLSDPLDGGEPNYKPRGTSSSIKDSIRIKPISHNARNSHER